MLVPIKWLKEYTDMNVELNEFCERMIMSGSNIETVEQIGEGIEGVVVGKIIKIDKHPHADRLLVAQVEVGAQAPIQICTGATNIFEGAFVPIALDGSRVPGPLHGKEKVEGGEIIRAGKLRDLDSNGMMCNCTELGFSDKVVPVKHKEGIWILEGEYAPGTDILDALQINTAVVDFEITPNRPDCLSMIGIAREAAATFGTKLCYPLTSCKNTAAEKSADYVNIEIIRADLCKRYVGRVVKDVKIEQSPWWLQKFLIFAGMRPINNIVDITNFVMLEYGQPIHAFDIRSIRERKIIVDTAGEGEIFTTLDRAERNLSPDMLMIKDGQGSVAIAGVMGGLDSEIKDDTDVILVESANFLGDSVRATSKKLGLRTEASSRFEKGIDPNLAKDACDRVCYLIELLGAGTVLADSIDVYPKEEEPRVIDIRASRMSKMLGVELSAEEVEKYLNALEIKTVRNGDIIRVTPPTVRMDLLEEVDYVEEVSRMYGFDRLPMTLPKSNVEAGRTQKQILRGMAKTALMGLGVNEIQTYSFVSEKTADNIGLPSDSPQRNFVRLLNPLGEDTSVMRTMLLANMLDVIGRNSSRSIESFRAFELGNVFLDKRDENEVLPQEKDSLCIAIYGPKESFYTLKGILEETLLVLGIKDFNFKAETSQKTFHPGRCASITACGQFLGTMGQVNPNVAEHFGISQEVYALEISFEVLYAISDTEKKYKPLPKYPAMKRDFAMVVEEDILVGDLEDDIRASAGELLESVVLFDIYRGSPVPSGSKSVAFSLTYRANDRTLKEAEVTEINMKVLVSLKEAYNASLREI
ncbi:MAG: phenylalanine--tRNA ligase subunit beta [Clostridia bacterium]|nr:phenylalanine--tRNA ligase subunit beta [Clostridia bacterium]